MKWEGKKKNCYWENLYNNCTLFDYSLKPLKCCEHNHNMIGKIGNIKEENLKWSNKVNGYILIKGEDNED